MLNYKVNPSQTLQGSVTVPGDKSISHRAVMLGSLANGVTEVRGFLEGEDCLASLHAMQQLGVRIEQLAPGHLKIHGLGLHGLKAAKNALDLGNAGTGIRLLTGLLAGQSFDSTLTGDTSLCRRPMQRIATPLRQMGAKIQLSNENFPPIIITGNQTLHAIDYVMPVASAQVKSCLLLAGLYAQGKTIITEPGLTRDHAERMLRMFGVKVDTNGNAISLMGGQNLIATQIEIPADISSAAFFMVGAAIAANSSVNLLQIGINPCRIGVINILNLMGTNLTLVPIAKQSEEPIADITVKSSALKGISIPPDQVPLAIDEFPALFIAAACAEGVTTLRGAEELRVKESDRIQVTADGLQAVGIKAETLPDGIRIEGGKIRGGTVDSKGDHRIAMAFAMAGWVASEPIIIKDCTNVATSFPNFVSLAQQLGLNIEVFNS